MKIKIFLTIFFISFNSNLGSTEPIDESKIYKNLRCLVCQGQSIADSNSDFAITLKMVVKDLIKNGKSEDEIYDFLSEKYGDWILYNPFSIDLWRCNYCFFNKKTVKKNLKSKLYIL